MFQSKNSEIRFFIEGKIQMLGDDEENNPSLNENNTEANQQQKSILEKVASETRENNIPQPYSYHFQGRKPMVRNSDKLTITLSGENGVGCSSFVLRLVYDNFFSNLESTIEDTYLYNFNGTDVEIFDIAPLLNLFAGEIEDYIQKSDGFILMYSVDDLSSFEEIEILYNNIKMSKNNMPIVICGNKIDLEESRKISFEQGKELAEKLGCPFFETSARLNLNLINAFGSLISLIKNQQTAETKVKRHWWKLRNKIFYHIFKTSN